MTRCEADALNLEIGVRVLLLHPEWSRTCADCLKWRYGPDGKRMDRPHGSGLWLTNDDGFTPCSECPKIPSGKPKERRYAVELSDKNYRAWKHWRECRAVNSFPDDPIVRRNAEILQGIQDQIDKQPMMTVARRLMNLKLASE